MCTGIGILCSKKELHDSPTKVFFLLLLYTFCAHLDKKIGEKVSSACETFLNHSWEQPFLWKSYPEPGQIKIGFLILPLLTYHFIHEGTFGRGPGQKLEPRIICNKLSQSMPINNSHDEIFTATKPSRPHSKSDNM